jgi:diacylglycerol kinase (ATP)
MHAIVVHNPDAGSGRVSAEEVLRAVRDAGYGVTYCSTDDSGFSMRLRDHADLVVAAGGDGTVGKVVKHMPDRHLPLAILPLGTANNIARSFGITGSPREIARGWRSGTRRRLDLGLASGGWGEARFIEGVGVGLLARAGLEDGIAAPPWPDGWRFARDLLRRMLAEAQEEEVEVRLDGEDLSGRYLLVEAMSIGHAGPGLHFASTADPGDGHFDLVCIEAERRDAVRAWLADPDSLPAPARTRRGRRVEIVARGQPVHIDDEFLPAREQVWSTLLALEPDGLEVLVPAMRR